MQDPCGAARSLISDGPLLELVGIEPERIVIRARSCAGGARSRACGKDAARAHSVYTRTIADLPWRGAPVILRVRARRFFCDEPSCERKIFCERLPDVAAYARKTGRLEEALLAIVLELGGRAGSRLAAELGLVEQWRDIRRLHLAGANIRFIARKLGVGSRTVYRYRDLQEPCRGRPTRLGRACWTPTCPTCWSAGRRAAARASGSCARSESGATGTARRPSSASRRSSVARRPPVNRPLRHPGARKESVAGLSPTAKNVAALFMRREEKLSEEQKEYLGRLCASDAALADARRLTQEFAGMVRGLESEKLDGWLEEAGTSEAEVVRKYAAGLKKDLSAVRAGLTERWSNGPVEGFVHKLELVMRQGYGRADFDLLRARVLAA